MIYVVNLASRLQGVAGSGEILITSDVFNHVKDQFPNAQKRVLTLKGLNSPVNGYALA
jgi:adenylate cyclase